MFLSILGRLEESEELRQVAEERVADLTQKLNRQQAVIQEKERELQDRERECMELKRCEKVWVLQCI